MKTEKESRGLMDALTVTVQEGSFKITTENPEPCFLLKTQLIKLEDPCRVPYSEELTMEPMVLQTFHLCASSRTIHRGIKIEHISEIFI